MDKTNRLSEKVVLITGASSGVGYQTAIEFAREGASVVLAARRSDNLEQLQGKIESQHTGTAMIVPTDVSKINQVEEMVRLTIESMGQLDVVVNNAGLGPTLDRTVADLPLDQYQRLVEVNINGVYFTTRSALPHLRDSNGHLVFVGSSAGVFPLPNSPEYSASKWWTRGFAFSLAGLSADSGVRVSIINPTGIRTEFGDEFREMTNEERFGPNEALEPEDVAKEIVHVSKSDATPTEINLFHPNQTPYG